jgi:hypothetical protein
VRSFLARVAVPVEKSIYSRWAFGIVGRYCRLNTVVIGAVAGLQDLDVLPWTPGASISMSDYGADAD